MTEDYVGEEYEVHCIVELSFGSACIDFGLWGIEDVERLHDWEPMPRQRCHEGGADNLERILILFYI